MLNPEIIDYVETHILPLYEGFDQAHRLNHARKVIANSAQIAADYDVDADMVYVTAAYHDMGLAQGRKDHGENSRLFMLADERLRRWFSAEQIQTMAQAAEDHRASNEREPRSIYGKIVSEADRDIEYMTILRRTVQYGLANYPEYSADQHYERTIAHLRDKYGRQGYLKLWLDTRRNRDNLQKIWDKLDTQADMRADFDVIFGQETQGRHAGFVALNGFSGISTGDILDCASRFGTPVYLYDEPVIIQRCRRLMAMPNAYGLTVRYVMKAHSTRAILRTIAAQGLKFDASSLDEARRVNMAGIALGDIILTTQEVPQGNDRHELESMILSGLKYNVCSLRQLDEIADFARENRVALAMRVHPGAGSGESASRNTGDNYSCFGIHLTDIGEAMRRASEWALLIDHVHVHIGSGADSVAWRENIDRELDILGKHFPDAHTISFGGGLKEARMPDESAADVEALGQYARTRLLEYGERTGRKLHMEIEPGTFVMANAGYAITRIIDKKSTGPGGHHFLVADGGIEINARPLLYGSKHPFYIVSSKGELVFSEFLTPPDLRDYPAVVVGRCCETGDSQTLDASGKTMARALTQPNISDLLVIGGVGAYCSSMSPMNYNSHGQAAEVMRGVDGELRLIRRRQTLEQIVGNEL